MQKDPFKKNPDTAKQLKKILEAIKKTTPGNAVELRIPQYGAIQCMAGVNHRRGTPANQVQMSAQVLIQSAQDPSLWSSFAQSGQIQASGQLSDLSKVLSVALQKTPKKGRI